MVMLQQPLIELYEAYVGAEVQLEIHCSVHEGYSRLLRYTNGQVIANDLCPQL